MTQLRHSKRDHCPIVELFQGMPLRLQAMTSDDAEMLTSEMHDPYTRTTGA